MAIHQLFAELGQVVAAGAIFEGREFQRVLLWVVNPQAASSMLGLEVSVRYSTLCIAVRPSALVLLGAARYLAVMSKQIAWAKLAQYCLYAVVTVIVLRLRRGNLVRS